MAALCIVLALATLGVYGQVSGFDFVSYDDTYYLTQNPQVKAGLSLAGVGWAFSTISTNWHPLTWLAFMLDWQLFGHDAGAHHLVNLGFHVANVLLLFLALTRLTGFPWRSAVAAGIFALHPLHVESVAWISELKDVMSTFFGLLALLFYARYAEQKEQREFPWRWYLPMVLAFALSLMAKAMLVTLPFVFLLLDIWPLRRLSLRPLPAMPALKNLIVEKLPLLVLAAAVTAANIFSHQTSEANVSLEQLPFSTRLAFVPVAYARYLGKAFWPDDLAMYYPYPLSPSDDCVAAIALLAVISFACLRLRDSRPWLLVGWLWFLGMLLPVIGLFQVGGAAIADRYMYMPLTGLSLAVVWEVSAFVARHPSSRAGFGVLAGAVLLALGIAAHQQAGYWHDSKTLYTHTLAVTTGNGIIDNNLAVELESEGEDRDAIDHYRKAADAGYAPALDHMARVLGRLGDIDAAIAASAEAIRLQPGGDPEGQDNLCAALGLQHRIDEAILHCNEALRLDPGFLQARFNLAAMYSAQGKMTEADAEMSRVIEAKPDFPGAQAALEKIRGNEGR